MSKSNVTKLVTIVLWTIAIGVTTSAYAGSTAYKYDAHGRVTEIDYPDGSVIKYTYDAAGNRTQVTR